MPTTPAQPVLTVNQPTPNQVVGLNKPFQITGQATDRGGTEPILIDSITVQVDSGPLIHATLKRIPNKTLTEVTFQATAQINSGNDPHTVTIVATDDQGLRTTHTVTVFTGQVFQTDTPAILLDLLTVFDLDPTDPQIVSFIQKIQTQLRGLSGSLAPAGLILIGPNLQVNPEGVFFRVRIGFWIEKPGFPTVVTPGFDLPMLSAAAATASFAATPLLTVPNPGVAPSFALSIPTTTLQHIVDALTPALKSQASSQGFAIDTINVQTSAPATVNTNVSGHILKGTVPASFTITETVGLQPVPDADPNEKAPAVLSTDSSSSVGSLLDWIASYFIPLLGDILVYAFYQVSSAASTKTGVAGSFLGLLPARIPFGEKDITIPGNATFTFPPFPTLNFFWNNFTATSTGLLGAGTTEIDSRTQADVKVTLTGPDSFIGLPDNIQEFTDPVMAYVLKNIAPDAGKFNFQITGGPTPITDLIPPPSPVVQSGTINPHFPLPAKPAIGDHHYTLTLNATESRQDTTAPPQTLTGTASKSILFRVKKTPTQGPGQ